jgi:Pex14 N-terminal domain
MTDSDQATKPEDRSDLLAKARSFLASPQVRSQDINAKRAFLVEKGLNDAEIAELLRTVVCVYYNALVLLHITFLFFQVVCTTAIHSSENLSPATSFKFACSSSWPSALVLMANWRFCSAPSSISCSSSSIVNYSYNLALTFKSAYCSLG